MLVNKKAAQGKFPEPLLFYAQLKNIRYHGIK